MANTIDVNELGQDEDKNQPGQSGNSTPPGQAPSNSGNAPAITSSQTSNPNQQRGSGYTNISKVLQANQGNGLGSAVGNNIQQVGNQAQDNLRNAQNQFNQQTQSNQFNTDQNKQTVENVLNDPTQAVNSQQGKQFQNLISGQYQGPQNLNNANQIQAQAGNLAQMGQALGSSGGRQALLQQMFGNPQYTQGQQTLDNLLLGQSQSPELQQARRAALTTQGQVNNAISGAAAQGQQQTQQAQQFGKSVQDQFGNLVNTQDQSLQNAALKAQTDRDAQYRQTLQDYNTGHLTGDEANLLGVTNNENTYNLLNDPSKYLSESALKANASNVASADDYAKMQALQKLGGQYAPQNSQTAFANYQDPKQAGAFARDQAISGDTKNFNTDLDSTKTNYNGIFDPAQQKLQSAQDINRLATGQVTDDERNSILNNPALAQQLQQASGGDSRIYNQIIGNMVLNQKYPGAGGGGILPTANSAWAGSNLQTAQTGFNNAKQQLLDAYGNPLTVQVGEGSKYPTLGNLGRQGVVS